MTDPALSRLNTVLERDESALLDEWVRRQIERSAGRDVATEAQLREQSRTFLSALRAALARGAGGDVSEDGWADVRQAIEEISRERARQGFSSSETASFIFSLKRPVLERVGSGGGGELLGVNDLIDQLGLLATEAYQRRREEVISRQQQELLELSTPVVRLWDNILALPLIGTLDSARTQVVMESLLQEIVTVGAAIAIIDITGVPTVDTLVAQHLLKTVAAARLMGADCIISGIRPQIAQTIVHLGVNLGDVTTKASLADAFAVALKRNGLGIAPVGQA